MPAASVSISTLVSAVLVSSTKRVSMPVAGAAVAVAEGVVLVLGLGAVDAGLDQPVGLVVGVGVGALGGQVAVGVEGVGDAVALDQPVLGVMGVVDDLGGEDRRQGLGAVLAEVIADGVERVAVGVDERWRLTWRWRAR